MHAMDFAGHGAEHLRDRPFRIDYFADNVLAFLAEQELDKVSIFGHSMGGYVGLYLAKAYPDKVERVFTFGTKFAWTPTNCWPRFPSSPKLWRKGMPFPAGAKCWRRPGP